MRRETIPFQSSDAEKEKKQPAAPKAPPGDVALNDTVVFINTGGDTVTVVQPESMETAVLESEETQAMLSSAPSVSKVASGDAMSPAADASSC